MGIGVGCFGDAAIFSFHATKVYNTIEGGAVSVHSDALYRKLYNLKNFGIRNEEEIEEVGANAKMNEFAAIMGLCNLKYVDENIALRKKKVQHYISLLQHTDLVPKSMFYDENIAYNYAYFPILLESEEKRNFIHKILKQNNIYSRKYFYPLTSDVDCYVSKYKNTDLDVARDISKRILVLPLYPELEEQAISEIVALICNHL